MIDYNCLISLNHLSFAQLNNPNNFEYRFLGIFPLEEDGSEMSLFDFIDNTSSESQQQKIDSKAVFEDSVYNFYSKRVAQSIAGFYNVLKLFPADCASKKYIERGNKIISL